MERKVATPAGTERAENPFLAVVYRQKLVEAVPAESVHLEWNMRFQKVHPIFSNSIKLSN